MLRVDRLAGRTTRPCGRRLPFQTILDRLDAARGRARERTRASIRRNHGVACEHWEQRNELTAAWKATCQSLSKVHACGYCGVSGFGAVADDWTVVAAPPVDGCVNPREDHRWLLAAPYAVNNTLAADTIIATYDPPSFHCCSLCAKSEATRNRRSQCPYMSPEYARKLLALHPLHAQMLAVLDCGFTVESRYCGYAHGELTGRSLLDI